MQCATPPLDRARQSRVRQRVVADGMDLLLEKRLAAIVQSPVRAELLARAEAAVRGGVGVLALPVSVPFVAEIAAEIAERTDAAVGLCDVVEIEHLNLALAAGAEFVVSPLWDEELVRHCRHRGLAIIPSVATPSELLIASRGHEGPIAMYPVTALGGVPYLARLTQLRPSIPILASGDINPDNGPEYLEAGAAAILIDSGLFPPDSDVASEEIITARAQALVEVCSQIPVRSRLSDG
jgi:2-dehydro-3-deoxyphosphogluconate aldolase / (4S)-4-hydroxy-2-oxoglutarate aldolase